MDTVKIPEHLPIREAQEAYVVDYAQGESLSRQKVSFEYFTFSLLMEGIKHIHTPLGKELIDPSQFLLVKRGHCLMTETLSEQAAYRSKLILFSKSFLLSFIKTHGIPTETGQKGSGKLYKVLGHDDYSKRYADAMEGLPLSPRMQQAKVTEFLIYCYETYGEGLFSFLVGESIHPSLRQVVEEHINENLSLEELSFLCNMSLSSFKRAFFQAYGATPSKWIKQQRLARSKNELQDVNLRASDIYLKYGFGSLSRYIQAFKETYGITPKQFQQQLK